MVLDLNWYECNYLQTDKSLGGLAKEYGIPYSRLRDTMHALKITPKPKYRGLTTGQHKKGIPPWNKGLTKDTDPRMKLAAQRSAEVRIQRGATAGAKHYKWAGDAVTYKALHKWVNYWKGKPGICVQCGATKNLDWANISGEYKRDLNDFKSLCRSCHMYYDNARRAK